MGLHSKQEGLEAVKMEKVWTRVDLLCYRWTRWNFLPISVGFFGMRETMHGMEKLLHNLLQVCFQKLMTSFLNSRMPITKKNQREFQGMSNWPPHPMAFSKRGIGAVIRNEKGDLMAAFASPRWGSFSPLTTELLAIKEGIIFAMATGLTPFMVEVDCLKAANLVNSLDFCWSENGALVEDIKLLMTS